MKARPKVQSAPCQIGLSHGHSHVVLFDAYSLGLVSGTVADLKSSTTTRGTATPPSFPVTPLLVYHTICTTRAHKRIKDLAPVIWGASDHATVTVRRSTQVTQRSFNFFEVPYAQTTNRGHCWCQLNKRKHPLAQPSEGRSWVWKPTRWTRGVTCTCPLSRVVEGTEGWAQGRVQRAQLLRGWYHTRDPIFP